MKKVWKKLKDNTGASLILVMVLFFMCVMVSSIIVATASTGASRNMKRQKQQQQYLSMMSAANLLAEEMKPENVGKFVGKATLYDYGCNKQGDKQHRDDEEEFLLHDEHSDKTETSGHDDIWSVDDTTDLEGLLGDLILEACREVYVERNLFYETEFWLKPEDDRLVDVHCKFYMDYDYEVSISFSVDGTSYAMTLICEATSVIEESENPNVKHEHYMKYNDTKDNGEIVKEEGDHDVGAIETIKLTTITWKKEDQTIRKGEN